MCWVISFNEKSFFESTEVFSVFPMAIGTVVSCCPLFFIEVLTGSNMLVYGLDEGFNANEIPMLITDARYTWL